MFLFRVLNYTLKAAVGDRNAAAILLVTHRNLVRLRQSQNRLQDALGHGVQGLRQDFRNALNDFDNYNNAAPHNGFVHYIGGLAGAGPVAPPANNDIPRPRS